MSSSDDTAQCCKSCQHFLPWFISAKGEPTYSMSDIGQCFKKRFFHTLYLTNGTNHEIVKVTDGSECSAYDRLDGVSEHYGTL